MRVKWLVSSKQGFQAVSFALVSLLQVEVLICDVLVRPKLVVLNPRQPGQLQHLLERNEGSRVLSRLLERAAEPLVAKHLLSKVLRVVADVTSHVKEFERAIEVAEVQKQTAEHLVKVNGRLRVHQVPREVGQSAERCHCVIKGLLPNAPEDLHELRFEMLKHPVSIPVLGRRRALNGYFRPSCRE